MTKSFAEQLAPIRAAIGPGDVSQGRSKPRCMCHNKYLEECLNEKPPVTEWVCTMWHKPRGQAVVNPIALNRCRVCGFRRSTK